MTVGMGDIATGLVLAGICALAWRRRRNVGGKTWAFRVVPLGVFLMMVGCDSGRGALCGVLLVLFAYAFAAYRGGWRLSSPGNRYANGAWWVVHAVAYFLMALIVCVPVAVLVRTVVRFSPVATDGDWPWREGKITEEMPFAVDYKRAKTLCAEYDKRIRFKSGKTIGIWPDTGGGGPFAVYKLASGEYYLVDGLTFDFIRSEYRVNCTNETVERKGTYYWILVPDGSLGITGGSDRDVMVKTAKGEIASSKTTPIGDSLAGRRFLGKIHTSGRFFAGGIDPLRGVLTEKGEAKWVEDKLPEHVPFDLEMRKSARSQNEFRVVFKSGKAIGFGCWLCPPVKIEELSKDVYCLKNAQTNAVFKGTFRVDVRREVVDLHYRNAWIRVPDGTITIFGFGQGGGRNGEPETYSITVQTEKGEVMGKSFEIVGQLPDAVKTIGVVVASGKFIGAKTRCPSTD